MKQTYKINDYISLKLLKNNKTVIFLRNKRFRQCAYLLLNVERDLAKSNENLNSIDEFSDVLDRPRDRIYEGLDPITEFWGHCSNIQAWVENNYDTRLLHSNLAFPLLKELKTLGDPIAKKVYKEEIISRISYGYLPVISFLIEQGCFNDFSPDELKVLFSEPLLLKNILTSLIKYRSEYTYNNNASSVVFQIFFYVDFKSFLDAYNNLSDENKALLNASLRYLLSNKDLAKINSDLLIFLKNEILSSKHPVISFQNKNFLINEGMLIINHKNVTDIHLLHGLENNLEIEVLLLQGNLISEIDGLQSLKNLRGLDLSFNKISNIKNLDNLLNLDKLNLQNNTISKIEGISNLRNLRELNLRENKIEEISGLENLSKLEYLHLDGNRIFKIIGLESLRNLIILNLNNNQISEIKGLGHLYNLAYLDLSNTPISEVKGLEQLLHLRGLKIDSTHIDPKLLKRLRYSKGKFQDAQLFVEYCRFKKNLKLRFDIQKLMDMEGDDYFCSLCKKEHVKGDLFKQHISYAVK